MSNSTIDSHSEIPPLANPESFRVRARIKTPSEPRDDLGWYARRVQLGELASADPFNDPPYVIILEGLAEDTEALKRAREGA